MTSAVLIVTTANLDAANALGEAMGWGPNSYSVPLSTDGTDPATHYGLHAWVTEEFQALIETGAYPSQVEAAGITQADYDAMMAALISSFWDDYVGHFATVCADSGLVVVTE